MSGRPPGGPEGPRPSKPPPSLFRRAGGTGGMLSMPGGPTRPGHAPNPFANPVLLGALIVLVLGIGVFISYGAEKGLPFVPTYDVSVEVPDAAKLVAGDEVRVGGARVGVVKSVTAEPGHPPHARLSLGLTAIRRLPDDSTVQVRPRSILGAKYVAITLGADARAVPAHGTLPLAQGRPSVEIDDALKIFDPRTRAGIQGTVTGFGDALAGRGADVNATISSIRALLGPAARVARLLLARGTDLPGFIDGAAHVALALQPVAPQLGSLVTGAADTLGALHRAGPALGQAIDRLPGTETAGAAALRRVTPVLADAASIARAIRPGTRVLPGASRRLAVALEEGTPTLRRARPLIAPLNGLTSALDAAVPPHSHSLANADTELIASLTSLEPTLAFLLPSQTVCNAVSLLVRNLASATSQGDAAGAWLSVVVVLGDQQNFQAATPDPRLHADPYPVEDATGCQSGNEPFTPGQHIGPPDGPVPAATERTTPPAEATARARAAGLLTPTPGARP